MSRISVLMGSVSAVALASVAAQAQAQDASYPDGYTLSVEGGLTFGKNTVAEDKLGSGPGPSGGIVDIQDNMGYRAAISMGKRIDPMWDLRVGGAINQQMDSVSTGSYSSGSGGYSGELTTDFDYETMDFEAGYRPALDGNMDVRLFGGIRGLHYKDSVDKVGAGGSGGPDKVGYNVSAQEEFIGVGPRVGIEASMPLSDSMFAVSGMVAGGAIFGVSRTSGEGSYTSGGSGGTIPVLGQEETATVYNLEAALGLDMHVTKDMTITAGYRVEGILGVNGLYGSGGSGGSGGPTDRWSHGPTVKLTGYFD